MQFQDGLVNFLAGAARAVFSPATGKRENPAAHVAEADLSDAEKRHAAALMRVNHCGEVCAQALYQGQALFARGDAVRGAMREAAEEEIDHLSWTAERIAELGGRQSVLNPLWYGGAFAIGAAAALVSDKVSLGFVAETEKQVSAHLQSHLQKLPPQDEKSRSIVRQMDIDEQEHATNAMAMGGAELPPPVRKIMQFAGGVMTRGSYWL